jgi:hypothetical protein
MPAARHVRHLARRFATSLWPASPPPPDEAWVASLLGPGEQALWGRLGGADRRHAIGVARRAALELGAGATRPVLAAALLHDVGKVEAGYGPWRRAAATVVGGTVGRRRTIAWGDAHRAGRRLAAYLDHDRRGAALLRAAGAEELTARWAADHHQPEAAWGVPLTVGRALKAADDD